MNKSVLVFLAILLLLLHSQTGARENPFVSGKSQSKRIELPAFASKAFGKIMIWQQKLNSRLSEQVRLLRKEKTWQTLWPLITACFLYGVVHAAGPGHGKVVVFSYFISKRSSIRKGFLLGNLISVFHAISGIVIVIMIYYVLKTAYMASFESISLKISAISYILIILMGFGLLIGNLLGLKRGADNLNDIGETRRLWDRKGILPMALAVGMVPCPGVVIVMLFALSFNLLTVGIIMSFIMALGMAATISLAGILSIMGQEGLLKGLSRNERAQHLVQKGLGIFGALLIMGFGTLLLINVL